MNCCDFILVIVLSLSLLTTLILVICIETGIVPSNAVEESREFFTILITSITVFSSIFVLVSAVRNSLASNRIANRIQLTTFSSGENDRLTESFDS